ncbi:MAG: hypothetical protein N4A62_11235 [Marinisporobacter sp.]|jgi:hypothetical protein|nr:hypothetical protein [Marinisporobacter sp.]
MGNENEVKDIIYVGVRQIIKKSTSYLPIASDFANKKIVELLGYAEEKNENEYLSLIKQYKEVSSEIKNKINSVIKHITTNEKKREMDNYLTLFSSLKVNIDALSTAAYNLENYCIGSERYKEEIKNFCMEIDRMLIAGDNFYAATLRLGNSITGKNTSFHKSIFESYNDLTFNIYNWETQCYQPRKEFQYELLMLYSQALSFSRLSLNYIKNYGESDTKKAMADGYLEQLSQQCKNVLDTAECYTVTEREEGIIYNNRLNICYNAKLNRCSNSADSLFMNNGYNKIRYQARFALSSEFKTMIESLPPGMTLYDEMKDAGFIFDNSMEPIFFTYTDRGDYQSHRAGYVKDTFCYGEFCYAKENRIREEQYAHLHLVYYFFEKPACPKRTSNDRDMSRYYELAKIND